MHWALISVSILASIFSGISFLGAPAETFANNLMYVWVVVGLWIATPIATTYFLPFFFKKNLYTAYEYLELRFSPRLRRLASAAFIFRGTLWIALAIYAPSLVVSEMMGISLWISILVTGLATLLYTTIGGMRAVIYTDVIQLCVFVAVLLLIVAIAIGNVPGGVSGIWKIAEAGGRTEFLDFTFSMEKRMTFWSALFGGFVISLSNLVTDQVSVQRYLSASSLSDSRRALWGKLVLSLPLIVAIYFSGLVFYAFYQTHPELLSTLSSPDRVLPHFVSKQLMAPLPGLLIAAILAATMSTVSAGVNSLTTAMIMDFVYIDNDRAPDASDTSRVKVARRWTLVFGSLTMLLALVVGRLGSLVEASNKIAGFLGGPMLGIFVLGICTKRSNAAGALTGAICGFFAVAAVGMFTSVSFMWYAAVGFLTTILVGYIISLLLPPPDAAKRSYSWAGSAESPTSVTRDRELTEKI